MKNRRRIVFSALIVCVLASVWLYTRHHPLVNEWNQFERPSRAVTEISQRIKELNADGKAEDIQALLKAIYRQLDLEVYTTMDKERLCKLYDKYNLAHELRGCYRDVISSELSQRELKAWIRVAKKQLEFNVNDNELSSAYDRLYESIANRWGKVNVSKNEQVLASLDAVPMNLMDEQDQYQIAKTLIKFRFEMQKAKQMLARIIDTTFDESLASKSYFVLARHAIENNDYKGAYSLYSEYILKYENSKQLAFFINKAHQRLLQLSVRLGSDSDFEQAALIANTMETRDLRSYFDVARKLSDQGLMKEAKSIYLRGINQVQMSNESYTLYQRVRLYTEIIRTGNDIGIDFAVHDGYIKKVDDLLEHGLHVELEANKELRYLHSQYLLWAADAYRMHGRLSTAESFYGRFIAIYPDNPDYEFAVYRFLRLCAQTQCNKGSDMISVLIPVHAGNWVNTVIGTFSGLMASIRKPAWKGEIEQWVN